MELGSGLGVGAELSMSDTYPMPKDGWTCFHCGERFRTPGAAQDHFGKTQESTAACQIKTGDERGLVMALRKAEDDTHTWRDRALSAEIEVETLEARVASLTSELKSYKPFRNCETLRDVFNVYDSMEGRALAAEGRKETTCSDCGHRVHPGVSCLESDCCGCGQ